MSIETDILADPRAAFGIAPISPDHPAGEDARASAEFDALDGEIRKLDSEGPNAVDWRLVADQGLDIIRNRSKDLLVGAWVTYALQRREGISGLATGLSLLKGMVGEHWDGLFPPARRERARVAPFDWLVGRVTPALADARFTDADAAALVTVQGALNDIDDAMSARLTKESLNLGDLVRAIRPHADAARRVLEEAQRRRDEEARRMEAEAEARDRPAPEAAPDMPVAVAAATANQPSPGSAASAVDLDSLPEMLWAQACALRGQDLADPRSYLLGRVGSWLRIEALPVAQDGATSVPSPVGLKAMAIARESGNPQQALLVAESLVWESPFCLDAHRHASEALAELDGQFAAARAAVQGQLAAFLLRFPAAATMTFSDGQPFADEDTRALATVAGAAGPSAAGGGPSDAMDAALVKATLLMGRGQAFEAHDLLAATLRGASSGRQRMSWQARQARFCLDHGYVAAALPLLDHLDRMIEARDLEQWEPELASTVAELRLRALVSPEAQVFDDSRRLAVEAARSRLARLDIAATIRLLAG